MLLFTMLKFAGQCASLKGLCTMTLKTSFVLILALSACCIGQKGMRKLQIIARIS